MPAPAPQFYRLFDGGLPPERASRDAQGTIPIRAARYCEAITSAACFGWYLFPPCDMALRWDGHTIHATTDGEEWSPVDDTLDFPGWPDGYDAVAPEGLRGKPFPMLTALPEPGTVQVSLGFCAITAPGWALLLRRPANYPVAGPVEHYEGIVETDRWCGPLFINLRITATGHPLRLHADRPLAMAQPLPRDLYAARTLPDPKVFDKLDAEAWARFGETMDGPRNRPERQFGEYAIAVRKGCPV